MVISGNGLQWTDHTAVQNRVSGYGSVRFGALFLGANVQGSGLGEPAELRDGTYSGVGAGADDV